MPFPNAIAKEITSDGVCAVCGWEDEPSHFEAHSATGLHLVECDDDSGQRGFLVSDTPSTYAHIRGEVLDTGTNPRGETAKHDGFCVCPMCHDEIHEVASLEWSWDKRGSYHHPPAAMLAEVTTFFVEQWDRPCVNLFPGSKERQYKIIKDV